MQRLRLAHKIVTYWIKIGNLSYYFDYDAFVRDLFMCDYFYDNGYVFRR